MSKVQVPCKYIKYNDLSLEPGSEGNGPLKISHLWFYMVGPTESPSPLLPYSLARELQRSILFLSTSNGPPCPKSPTVPCLVYLVTAKGGIVEFWDINFRRKVEC